MLSPAGSLTQHPGTQMRGPMMMPTGMMSHSGSVEQTLMMPPQMQMMHGLSSSGLGTRSPGSASNGMGGSTNRNSASTSSRGPMDPKLWGYAIVDPLHPSLQRIPVPPSCIHPTAGAAQYNCDVAASSVKPCSSSVCMKFANSKDNTCPLGEHCTNFHVDKNYLERCRALTGPICCVLLDDCFGHEMRKANTVPSLTNARYILVLEDKSEIEIVPGQLAFTVGLEHLYVRANDVRVINLKKQVCRMHLEGKCKWTKDCGHVHICRDLVRYLGMFHYPSLHFLLMTDNDVQIQEKLQTPDLIKFLSSHSAIPLLEALVTARKSKAIAVLEAAGIVMPIVEIEEADDKSEDSSKRAHEATHSQLEVSELELSTFDESASPTSMERTVPSKAGAPVGFVAAQHPVSPHFAEGPTNGLLSGTSNDLETSNNSLTPMLPLASSTSEKPLPEDSPVDDIDSLVAREVGIPGHTQMY